LPLLVSPRRLGYYDSMDEEEMIRVEALGKRFPSSPRWAIENLSFSCKPGEVVGLLGENGAGKTTTLRILATSIEATRGRARLNGYDLREEPQAVRRSIGMLFGGSPGLYDRLTARENIRYFAELNGVGDGDFEARLPEIIELLEMEAFMDRRAGTFSTGMRQKTAIARSIIHDPAVLLLDEPASGLDIRASKNIQSFIFTYRKRGKTVLFSSHDLQTVRRLCDRVLIIHKGRLQRIVKKNEKDGGESLEKLFLHILKEDGQ
jgi:sodium transport system ATP-binding protein